MKRRTRIILQLFYFATTYAILSYYTYGDYFCSSSRAGQSRSLTTARLALLCKGWDLVASACGMLAATVLNNYWRWVGNAPLVGALVAGAGFAYMPFWINEGLGRLLYLHSCLDVSCFFGEGNGIGFLFIVAPALATVTLIRECLIAKSWPMPKK